MGCGASANPPRPCNPAEMAALCGAQAKNMALVCIDPALAKSADLKVTAPKEVEGWRKTVTDLREAAKSCASTAERQPEPEKKTGMMEGMMNKMVDAATKVADNISAAAGSISEAAINTAADGMEDVINTVEKPFTTVGQEIVDAKKNEIKEAFVNFINGLDPEGSGKAIELVRGQEPWGAAEYAAVPSGAVTDFLCRVQAEEITTLLQGIVDEEIKKHAVTKNWDAAISKYNATAKMVGDNSFMEKSGVKMAPVQLNLSKHIVSQCVEQIVGFMNEEEKKVRADPSNKSPTPETFAKVFSGSPLDDVVYKNKDT